MPETYGVGFASSLVAVDIHGHLAGLVWLACEGRNIGCCHEFERYSATVDETVGEVFDVFWPEEVISLVSECVGDAGACHRQGIGGITRHIGCEIGILTS